MHSELLLQIYPRENQYSLSRVITNLRTIILLTNDIIFIAPVLVKVQTYNRKDKGITVKNEIHIFTSQTRNEVINLLVLFQSLFNFNQMIDAIDNQLNQFNFRESKTIRVWDIKCWTHCRCVDTTWVQDKKQIEIEDRDFPDI